MDKTQSAVFEILSAKLHENPKLATKIVMLLGRYGNTVEGADNDEFWELSEEMEPQGIDLRSMSVNGQRLEWPEE